MKICAILNLVLFLSSVMVCCGQGTPVYDQQSLNLTEGGAAIEFGQPMGQSFTPSLSGVEFVELYLYDGNPSANLGASVYVNLRSDSITGPILGTTAPVSIPAGFAGSRSFSFSNMIAVEPGTTYYFQPVIDLGGGFGLRGASGNPYAGGSEIYQGAALVNNDLWFREGIVVPEPSMGLMALAGSGLLIAIRRKHVRGH